MALIVLASCAKHKERKAWKQWYGNYEIVGSQELMYDDFHGEPVYASEIGINKYGISFTTPSGTEPSCTFEKMDECDISGFDYQLKFVEIRLFLFGAGVSGQLESPSEEELNQDFKYYFKRLNDSKIMFMKKGGNGQETQIIFNLVE